MELTLNPNSVSDYRTFLRIKQLPIYDVKGRTVWFPDEYATEVGLRVERQEDLPIRIAPHCFDYQRDGSIIAIRRRKFAHFWRPGLGKTNALFEHVRHARKALPKEKRCLIVSPLMVIDQTLEEAAKFYQSLEIEQVKARDLKAWLRGEGGIGITNYEAMTDGLERGNLGYLGLDEACFAKGTPVDVVENGFLTQKPIENISKGDTIINASGFDTVAGTSLNEVPYAIAVTAGKRIIVSPNHRFFTVRGWVRADGLKPGDSVLSPSTAMRVLRGDISPEGHIRTVAFLRKVLLSEMANEPARDHCQDPLSGSSEETRGSKAGVVRSWEREGGIGAGENPQSESNEQARCSSEGLGDHEAARMQAGAGREWQAVAVAAAVASIRTRGSLFSRIPNQLGKAKGRIPNLLQGGHRQSDSVYCNRDRREVSQGSIEEVAGQEENGDAAFVRVDGVEVLESGHPELDQFRHADGKLYFYDLAATRHPSYSVAGMLVHNSLLKSHYGKWGQVILRLGRGLDWKLCLTGTPAPNDRIEYANHAVFLDHHPNVNSFLARYFVNRGETQERWELKPHALEPFYRGLSHWSLFLNDPGTYGWVGNSAPLPPIHVHVEHYEMTPEQEAAYKSMTGNLVVCRPGGIGSRSKLSQIAKGRHNGEDVPTEKFQQIRRLLEGWPNESTIIWCKYNPEQDRMAVEFPQAASIDGRTPHDERMRIIHDFKAGRIKTLITKPKLMQFGLNLQVVTRHVWSTLQDSYEEFWQGCCRSNRVGSTKPLHVHIPVNDLERPMVDTVLAKANRVNHDMQEQEAIFKRCGLTDWRNDD